MAYWKLALIPWLILASFAHGQPSTEVEKLRGETGIFTDDSRTILVGVDRQADGAIDLLFELQQDADAELVSEHFFDARIEFAGTSLFITPPKGPAIVLAIQENSKLPATHRSIVGYGLAAYEGIFEIGDQPVSASEIADGSFSAWREHQESEALSLAPADKNCEAGGSGANSCAISCLFGSCATSCERQTTYACCWCTLGRSRCKCQTY